MSANDETRTAVPDSVRDATQVRSSDRPAPTPPAETDGTNTAVPETNLDPNKTFARPADQQSRPATGALAVPGYVIDGTLGRGGMGVVYKATQTGLNRPVALKMLIAGPYADPDLRARFLLEAESVAALEHPHIIRVFAFGESGGHPYLAMEFVPGGTLAERVQRSGPLSGSAAADLVVKLAEAVAHAHSRGVVHRDIKPLNVLLTADGEPRLTDFGLAKVGRADQNLSVTGQVLGTPAYMAPEQAAGKVREVGTAADVYALGAVLYDLLTGRPPFRGDSVAVTLQKVIAEEPVRPRRLNAAIPHDLETVCLKCLEKQPHHRYPTAAALADDLGRFLRGEQVSVRPIGPAARAYRWARKRPGAAALVAAGVALAVAVPAVAVGVQARLDHRGAEVEAADRARIAAEQLADAHDTAAREARRAKNFANSARANAERLGEARELFGIQNALRTRAAGRASGWTVESRGDLERAVALARDDRPAQDDLRSAAAVALLAADLVPLPPVGRGLTAGTAATDPKSGLVAVGEQAAWLPGSVLLIDPASGRTVRRLTFPSTPVRSEGGGALAQDGVRALAFSPDGTRLFVGTRSSRVVRFDLTGKADTPAKVWSGPRGALERLAVSPDGKTVYGGSRPEPAVLAWSAETGQLVRRFEPPAGAGMTGFAALPSGRLLITNAAQIGLWESDGTPVWTAPAPGAHLFGVTLGPLLVAAEHRLEVFDIESRSRTSALVDPNDRRSAHDQNLRSIAVHPSGAFAATAADFPDRIVKVWEVASGRLIGAVTVPGTMPIAVAWSGDGTALLATGAKDVMRWRFAAPDAQRFATLSGRSLSSAAFAPDGRVAAVGVRINGHRELLAGEAGGAAVPAVVFDPEHDGTGIAAGPKGVFAVTMGAPGIVRWTPGGAVLPAAFTPKRAAGPRFSPDGNTLWAIVDGQTVRTYDPVGGTQRGCWDNSIANVLTGLASVNTLAVGPTAAAAGTRDGSVYLLDLACAPTSLVGPSGGDPVTAIALARDAAFVVTGSQSGKLRAVRAADKSTTFEISAHPTGVTALALDPSGALLVSGGRDRAVRLWRRTGDRFVPILTVSDLSGEVRELQFDAAGGRLLVLLAHEHAVRVWDLARLNAQLAELKLGW